jgi:hypothetical protein
MSPFESHPAIASSVGWLKALGFPANPQKVITMTDSTSVSASRADAIPVRVLIISDRTGVRETIDHLCSLGFSDRIEWSKIMPKSGSDDFMSVLTKYRIE